MKTTKPIATISYNTREYLELVCNDLMKSGDIVKWYAMPHKAEKGGKDHIHIMLIPSGSIDTLSLSKRFEEIDKNNPKPLGVDRQWHKVLSLENWFAYQIHDSRYLELKQEEREIYDYSPSLMFGSEDDNEETIATSLRYCLKTMYVPPILAMDWILSGQALSDILRAGYKINPRDIGGLKAYEVEVYGHTASDRERHYIDKIDKQRERIDDLQRQVDQLTGLNPYEE